MEIARQNTRKMCKNTDAEIDQDLTEVRWQTEVTQNVPLGPCLMCQRTLGRDIDARHCSGCFQWACVACIGQLDGGLHWGCKRCLEECVAIAKWETATAVSLGIVIQEEILAGGIANIPSNMGSEQVERV